MLIRNLFEAPLADFAFIDASKRDTKERSTFYDPGGDSFYDDDLKLAQNPKWKTKLVKQFANTKHPINLYLFNSRWIQVYDSRHEATSNTPVEGVVTPTLHDLGTWAGTYLPQDFQRSFGFLPPNYETAINVLFVQNEANERLPLTPWIVGHRIIHAMAGIDNRTLRDAPRWEIEEAWRGLMAMRHRLEWLWAKKLGKAMIWDLDDEDMADMMAHVSTLTSARNRKIARSGEFLLELMTQYLFTGKISINIDFVEDFDDQRAITNDIEKVSKHLDNAFRGFVGQLLVF